MTPDSFAHALDQLDPGSRALLDLSLHRGLDDGEIAELLGSDPEYVSSSREAAIAQLAADLGMHADADRVREALMEMPEDAWRRENGEPSTVHRPSLAEEATAPVSEQAVPRRRRSRVVIGSLVVVGAVAAIVIASSGGGSKSTPKQAAPAPTSAPSQPAGVALTSLSSSSPGKGTASLDGRRLTLSVSGLPKPAGSYEVWLYNDEIDAVPVTSFRSGSTTVKAKLPQSSGRYRYVDVSLELADGNPNHSGQSVLRVPLRSLR